MTKKFAASAAALALCSTSSLQAAQQEACLTSSEMHGLVAYFLPAVIDDVAGNCAAYAPASAYIRAGLPGLKMQLGEGRSIAWPMARAAFLKLSGRKDGRNLAGLSDKALRPLVDEMLAAKMSIKVDADTCGEVNDIAEALAPLDADQTVHLLATVFSAVARKDNKLRSCPRGI
ncbi:MAG: hypothetical protein AB7F98_10330 [Novosphingobium sp.]